MATYTPAMEPPTYPCYLFRWRRGGVFGYASYSETLTPLQAVYEVFLGCDFYPYRYREVGYFGCADAADTLDVYVATSPTASKYVASLARIYPTCCFCGGAMKHGEQSPWLYGYDAERVAKKREARCCASCYASKVQPVEEAEWRRLGGAGEG